MEETLVNLSGRLCRDIDTELLAGRDSSALELIDKAGEAVSNNAEVQFRLGIVLRNLGRLNESVEVLGDVSGKCPDNIHALHQLAISQHLRGDMAASDAALDAVLALSPGHPDILLGKIHNAERAADPRQLLERAGQALQAHPSNRAFALLYGDALRKAGRLADSARHFDSLFCQHHDVDQVCLEMARTRLAQRRFSAAQGLLEKLLRANPDALEARLLGIDCAVSSGRLRHALQLARDGMRPADAAPELVCTLARLYRTVQRPQQALDVLEGLGGEFGEQPQVALIRADALTDLGEFDQALALYRSALCRDPYDANALLKVIDIALHRYGGLSASRILDDLQARLATGAQASLVIEAAAHAGDWERLLELCSAPGQQAYGKSDARAYFIARARFGLGNPAAAKRALLAFVAANPADFRAAMLLADIELALGNREVSFAVRRGVLTTEGLAQQGGLLVHVLDLLRTGATAEAKALFATLGRKRGYLPTPTYIDEMFRQGDAGEAAACAEEVRCFLGGSQSTAATEGAPDARREGEPALDAERLARLLDFDGGCPLWGSEIHVAALMAWQLTEGVYGDFVRWNRRARQAAWVDRLLHSTPAPAELLNDFVVPPDPALLRELQGQRRGVVLATSHMGPPAGRYLTRLIPNIHYFQNLQRSTPFAALDATGIAVTGRAQEAAVAAVGLLRRGGILSTTPDVDIRRLTRGRAMPTTTATSRLFGVEVEISNMAAKLSRELKVPSYWLQSHWRDGKIHFAIEPLPMAEPDEEPDAWYCRWARAYLQKLEAHMASAPENQNLEAPLWRYLLYYGHESATLRPIFERLAALGGD